MYIHYYLAAKLEQCTHANFKLRLRNITLFLKRWVSVSVSMPVSMSMSVSVSVSMSVSVSASVSVSVSMSVSMSVPLSLSMSMSMSASASDFVSVFVCYVRDEPFKLFILHKKICTCHV